MQCCGFVLDRFVLPVSMAMHRPSWHFSVRCSDAIFDIIFKASATERSPLERLECNQFIAFQAELASS